MRDQTETSPETGVLSRSEQSDRDLLRALVEGRRGALATLYDRHSRVVYAYTAARLEGREDIEEISQDAFVTLWRKRSTITIAGDSLLPWLLVTSRNLIANRRRSLLAAGKRRASAAVDEATPDSRPGPDELVERDQLLAYVEAAASALPEPDRTVFELCIRGDHSYEDAAAQAGITPGAVRNRLSRLRARLRNELHTLRGTP
ncbi:sigma-70 family RNA polymerase sigma factor [Leifsonia sp. WHRI 6310E]|uniref:RNA polymerase sigma factor n=1 Tax=Leifsonia sp. WHRI 6310E TaxID=3162562 RepID=UPI0032EF832B